MTAPPIAELYSPDFLSDPYPLLGQLRGAAPVCWAEHNSAFVVTGYEDCITVLMGSEQFADTADDGSPLSAMDAEQHAQYRNLVTRALSHGFLADLERGVQQRAKELIDRFERSGETDFMSTVAYPLPTLVLADTLGLSDADRPRFIAWADDYTRALNTSVERDGRDQYRTSIGELVGYLGYRLAVPSANQRPNLLTRLADARLESARLSTANILGLCHQLMVAARDLTTGLIGNCLHALLCHPDQLAHVRAEPVRLAEAIEESLRWDTPVLGQARTSLTGTQVHGVPIPAGSTILVMLGAANHDPRIFEAPDRFDINRPNAAQHLAFGRGSRFCLGAALARLETRVVLGALFDQLGDVRLIPERPPARRLAGQMLNLRVFRTLPIAFSRK